MEIDTFFTDHWRDIEDERIARYEEMFVWHDAQQALVAPAQLAEGMRVLDVGCGPGFFAGGLAGLVGAAGRVDGVDINARFVSDANARFDQQAQINFHHITDHVLPFADACFDRVICKNVLEYVPDLARTLSELHRVTKVGGKIHVIDSDWGFVIVEPWSAATTTEFFAAASPAFNEPYIGRRIAGRLNNAGFAEVRVRLSPFVDQSGRGLHVLRNMASYIATFDTMPKERVDGLLAEVEAVLKKRQFLFCLPQFLVTAERLGESS